MPVTKTAYIFTTALKSAQRKGGADVKKRRYHGHSGKRRLLAVMLAMAMLFGMSTISAYADEIAGKRPVDQVDVDVGATGMQPDVAGAQSGNVENAGGDIKDKTQVETGQTGVESESVNTGLEQTATGQQDAIQSTEELTESDMMDTESSPLLMNLQQSTAEKVVPEHHKYIRYNGNDSYTLTLNVKGAYASESVKPKVDVLLIIDKSGSMDEEIRNGYKWQSKMTVLKNVVSGTTGLTEAILGTRSTLDARMAVVSYSGNKRDGAYNDAWTEQAWTDSKATIDNSVKSISAYGGTNWEAGLRTGAELLGKCRSDAQKIVVFLSDGEPTFYYDSRGDTAGNGSSYDSDAYSHAQTQLRQITGLNAFYTIGFGSAWGSGNTRMSDLLKSSSASATKYYKAADSDQLADAFKEIAESIEYTCRDVTITDVLSDYVELPDNRMNYTVTATKGGVTTDITRNGTVTVQYHADTKTVTAAFKSDFVLDKDTVYAVNFEVKPMQKAYDEYADQNGTYPHMGSAGSDAPGNATSAGKNGFYSNINEKVSLTYTYGPAGASSDTDVYQEKPVVQVSDTQIPVTKRWANTDQNARLPEQIVIRLYRDNEQTAYRTLALSAADQWTGTFTHVAKGHTYRIAEDAVDGYEATVSGNAEQGYVVINTKMPSLTVQKKVEGKLGNKTKQFDMKIRLVDKDGNPVTGIYGGVEFDSNGEAVIPLRDGEQVCIEKLPVGASYLVTEIQADKDGYQTSYEKCEGTLSEDQTATVINRYMEEIPDSGIRDAGSFAMGGALALLAGAGLLCITLIRRRRNNYNGKETK